MLKKTMSNEILEPGKYFVCIVEGNRGSFLIYCYILKIIGNIVVYRWLLYVDGMDKIVNNKWLKRWNFNIGKKDVLSKELVLCYPLQLVLLNFFKAPSEYFSKKQRERIKQAIEIERNS